MSMAERVAFTYGEYLSQKQEKHPVDKNGSVGQGKPTELTLVQRVASRFLKNAGARDV